MDGLIGNLGYFNFIIVLCVLIFVHELGHYLAARFCGIGVEVFSIGFGPELIGWNDKRGTRWKISVVPLGGYVKMSGEMMVASDADISDTADGSDINNSQANTQTIGDDFQTKSLKARAFVVAAGPLANFLYAFVVLTLAFMFIGKPELPDFLEAGIGSVQQGSAAEQAGFLPGDHILTVNDKSIGNFDDLRGAIAQSEGKKLSFQIQRGTKRLLLFARPDLIERKDDAGKTIQHYRLGVGSSLPKFVKLSAIDAVVSGFDQTWVIITGTLSALGDMITGQRGTDELGGPIRIVELSNEFAQLGFLSFLSFTVVLSVNLGLLNLFPIPVLDGGHLVFYAYEAIRGKALSVKMQGIGLRIGMALLITLMIFATYNDILRLFS